MAPRKQEGKENKNKSDQQLISRKDPAPRRSGRAGQADSAGTSASAQQLAPATKKAAEPAPVERASGGESSRPTRVRDRLEQQRC
jgi:hypothetical protein